LFLKEPIQYATPIVTGIFVLTILISLLFVLELNMVALAVWIISVFVFAIISKGYSYCGIDYRLFRTVQVLPFFILMLAKIISPYFMNITRLRIIYGTIFFILITGLLNQIQYLETKKGSERHRHYIFINWFQQHLYMDERSKNAIISFSESANKNYVSLGDNLQYYLPTFKKEVSQYPCNYP